MPPGFDPGNGGSVNIDGMEAAGFAWGRVMKDPVTIIGGNFIALICMGFVGGLGSGGSRLFQIFGQDMQRSDPEIFLAITMGISTAGQLLNLVVSSFFVGGYTRFMLNIARGQSYAIGDIFGGTGLFLKVLIARFLVGLAVGLGMLLCFIPGIIVGLGLSQTMYLVVDKGMDPIPAMKESWRLTDGQKANFFLWSCIGFGIALLGVLACCVGIYVAVPVLAVGAAFLHLRLTRQPTATA